jgi:hypothetical protein
MACADLNGNMQTTIDFWTSPPTTPELVTETAKVKSGVCPADRVGQEHHSDKDCVNDFDCSGDQKCCFKAGRLVCRMPDTIVAGKCPQLKSTTSTQSTCDSDYDCNHRKKKCCETNNGIFMCAVVMKGGKQ